MRPILREILTKARWQILIGAACMSIACWLGGAFDNAAERLPDIKSTTTALAAIGSLLALTTSISFAFLLFHLSQTNTRKYDLYHKFVAGLFAYDKAIKEHASEHDDVVHKARSISFELKKLRLTDFPMDDGYWGNTLDPLLDDIREPSDDAEENNVACEILEHLSHLEYIANEIAIMCIKQIIAGIYIDIVVKAFATIAILILTIVANQIDFGVTTAKVLSFSPVLFGVLACLYILEIGLWLKREGKEMIDFTQESSEDEADDDVDTYAPHAPGQPAYAQNDGSGPGPLPEL